MKTNDERIESLERRVAALERVSVEGRSEIGPQKGVQSLADKIREFAVELAGGTWTAFAASSAIEGFADCADALEAERDDWVGTWRVAADRAAAMEAERDRLAADIAIMRDADLTATDVQRRRAEKAEAAVARVRALVHDTSARVGALMFTPMTRARQYVTGVTLDDLRAALDGEGA